MNEGKKEVWAEAKGDGFLDRDHPLVADLLRRVVDDLADRLRPTPPKPSSRRRRGHLVRRGNLCRHLAEIVPTWAISSEDCTFLERRSMSLTPPARSPSRASRAGAKRPRLTHQNRRGCEHSCQDRRQGQRFSFSFPFLLMKMPASVHRRKEGGPFHKACDQLVGLLTDSPHRPTFAEDQESNQRLASRKASTLLVRGPAMRPSSTAFVEIEGQSGDDLGRHVALHRENAG